MSIHHPETQLQASKSANQRLIRDLVTFGVILCLVVGGLAGLYYYDQSTHQIGALSKQLFESLVD